MPAAPTILVTGGSGQLGGELVRRAADAGWRPVGTWLTRPADGPQLDVCDAGAVESLLGAVRPAAVVHTAYERSGPRMEAVNAGGARNVARAAARMGARLIHLSTDVVFDGGREGAYRESDLAAPVTAYGRSKLAAERAVLSEHPEALVLRTSLLYGRRGPHERAVADALAGRSDMAFFTDEVRCPVHVGDLAAAILVLAGSQAAGILHAGGADAVSRYAFAQLVARAHGLDPTGLRAAKSAGGPVRRPLNCALDSSRLAAVCNVRLRGVREVLATADLH